jgi:hypothetical protein
LGKYLNLLLLKGKVKKEAFLPIIESVNRHLSSWKSKLLNKAGKVCLAKSVLSSLPVYAMQALWIPQSVCDHVDKSIRSFIWSKHGSSRSWHLVSWTEKVNPKRQGGLGLGAARQNNIALLGKLVGSFIEEPDKLWVKILYEKYIQDDHILSI